MKHVTTQAKNDSGEVIGEYIAHLPETQEDVNAIIKAQGLNGVCAMLATAINIGQRASVKSLGKSVKDGITSWTRVSNEDAQSAADAWKVGEQKGRASNSVTGASNASLGEAMQIVAPLIGTDSDALAVYDAWSRAMQGDGELKAATAALVSFAKARKA